ncbi:MAG: RHS repeat-associated core domain-containing protein, partial [Reinekea sp.]
IHMQGRVYDPTIGRFLQADPFVQAPDQILSYNRYAYVWNNPLTGRDPSGFYAMPSTGEHLDLAGAQQATENNALPGRDHRAKRRNSNLGNRNDSNLSSGNYGPYSDGYGHDSGSQNQGNGDSGGGAPISDEERELLSLGKFPDFWRSRFLGGDPVAKTALTGWGDPDYVDANFFQRMSAKYTWWKLSRYLKSHSLDISMEEIGLNLAMAHANAVDLDQRGVPNLLSPNQVAGYHHEVFGRYGIPKEIFGGTLEVPLIVVPSTGGWDHPIFSPNSYSVFWCSNCDSTP